MLPVRSKRHYPYGRRKVNDGHLTFSLDHCKVCSTPGTLALENPRPMGYIVNTLIARETELAVRAARKETPGAVTRIPFVEENLIGISERPALHRNARVGPT